jgi:natural product biosynthesis luciferase-like monooxygenase protein
VWLAVTSLSFDISVLELLWTLTRGFEVVIYSAPRGRTPGGAARRPAPRDAAARPISFSLFYFASDEGEGVADKYELLLEGARSPTQHGFEAVWTPERHFHAFGGLYPNPSVASAAIAAVTSASRSARAAVVLPLHHPIRVAEEWALVDNLSKRPRRDLVRVGLAAERLRAAPGELRRAQEEDVRGHRDRQAPLARGGRRLPRAHGRATSTCARCRGRCSVSCRSWVTIAGQPADTYAEAGRARLQRAHAPARPERRGAGGEAAALPRAAWREAGFTRADRHVTLMLHTYVGDDDARGERDGARTDARIPAQRDGPRRGGGLELPDLQGSRRRRRPVDGSAVLGGPQRRTRPTRSSTTRSSATTRPAALFGTPESCVAMIASSRCSRSTRSRCSGRLRRARRRRRSPNLDASESPEARSGDAEASPRRRRKTGADDSSIPALIERHKHHALPVHALDGGDAARWTAP